MRYGLMRTYDLQQAPPSCSTPVSYIDMATGITGTNQPWSYTMQIQSIIFKINSHVLLCLPFRVLMRVGVVMHILRSLKIPLSISTLLKSKVNRCNSR